jgi:hypothetical protein
LIGTRSLWTGTAAAGMVAALLVVRLVGAGHAAAAAAPRAGATAPMVTPPPAPRPPEVPADALFFDDFSQGAGRWSFDRDSVWTVRWGMLCASLPAVRQVHSLAVAGDSTWGDIAVDVDICQIRGVDKGLLVRVRDGTGIGVDVRGGGYQDVLLYRREFPLGRAHAVSGNGTWNHLRVECQGGLERVFLNGVKVLEHGDTRGPGGGGRIALPAYTGGVGECAVYYDNVLVTPLR